MSFFEHECLPNIIVDMSVFKQKLPEHNAAVRHVTRCDSVLQCADCQLTCTPGRWSATRPRSRWTAPGRRPAKNSRRQRRSRVLGGGGGVAAAVAAVVGLSWAGEKVVIVVGGSQEQGMTGIGMEFRYTAQREWVEAKTPSVSREQRYDSSWARSIGPFTNNSDHSGTEPKCDDHR